MPAEQTSMERVFDEIRAERAYQDEKWGGAEHDRRHGSWDWCVFLAKHLGRFAQAIMSGSYPAGVKRRTLVRVAALAVAALEHAPDLQIASAPTEATP